MEERSDSGAHPDGNPSDVRDEVRTIGFRLREIQRLLSARVEQENRRLEAEGIDPITEGTFFKRVEGRRVPSDDATRYLIDSLAGVDVFEHARVTLADGTTIEGRVNPIAYTPNDRLRLEIQSRGEDVRYELRAVCENDRWSVPVLRRRAPGEDEWTDLGEVDSIRTLGH